MKMPQRVFETMKVAGLVAVLAVLVFATSALAEASDPEGPTEDEVTEMMTRMAPALEAGAFPEEEFKEMLQRWGPAAGPAGSPQARDADAEDEASTPGVMPSGRDLRKANLNAQRHARREIRKAAAERHAATAALSDRPAAVRDIHVSFKVDPRLTRSLYMGDRWVPVPYAGTRGQDIVEARVKGLDARGAVTRVAPKWVPEDPKMLTVSPAEGSEVKITVHRPGRSRLDVVSGGVSRQLYITAAQQDTGIQVEIAQMTSGQEP
jgi:hypothetical protein